VADCRLPIADCQIIANCQLRKIFDFRLPIADLVIIELPNSSTESKQIDQSPIDNRQSKIT